MKNIIVFEAAERMIGRPGSLASLYYQRKVLYYQQKLHVFQNFVVLIGLSDVSVSPNDIE
jgi:hypothetical protein